MINNCTNNADAHIHYDGTMPIDDNIQAVTQNSHLEQYVGGSKQNQNTFSICVCVIQYVTQIKQTVRF